MCIFFRRIGSRVLIPPEFIGQNQALVVLLERYACREIDLEEYQICVAIDVAEQTCSYVKVRIFTVLMEYVHRI